MAGYQLYIPGARGQSDQLLADLGLADLAADRSPDWTDVLQGGPDDRGTGKLCAWRYGDPERDPPLTVEGHQWEPARPDPEHGLPAGRYWLGIDPDRPPGPADLGRDATHPGHPVKLDDGHDWRVPIATQLPHRYGLDDEGRPARRIVESFQEFWNKSTRYAEVIFAALEQIADTGESIDIPLVDCFEYSVEALAFNYRVNRDVVSRLGLLSDASMAHVVRATIDLPDLLAALAQKKTAEPAGIPAT